MTTGTPRRERVRLPPAFLTTIALGTLLQPLNSSMIAVALVSIREEFNAGSAASWLLSGLNITTAVAAPAMGRLADLIGPRRVYLAGMALVATASAATPFVPGLGWLVAIRVLLGLGTAAQYPAGVALIRVESDRRGARAGGALGLLALCGQASVAVGPSLGGVLVGAFGWQAVFLVNLPLVLAGSVLALRVLPPAPGSGTAGRAGEQASLLRRLDLPGMATFTAAMTALMAFLLSVTDRPDWWLLVAFPGLLAAFVAFELRAPQPFLDLRSLAGNTALTGTYLRVGLTYVAFYQIFFGLPQWLEQGRGLDVALTGLVMLPMSGLAALNVVYATRLERRRGPRPLLVIGSTGLLAGGLLLAFVLGGSAPLWLVFAVSALLGLPNAFNSLGNQAEMFHAADPAAMGAASGLYRTSQYVGANLAAALLEVVFAGPPSDPGLHRMGLTIAAIAVLLLAAALLGGRGGSGRRGGGCQGRRASTSQQAES